MSRVTRVRSRTFEVFAILLACASFAQAASNVQTFALSDSKDLVLVNVKADPVEYQGRKAVRLTKDTGKDGSRSCGARTFRMEPSRETLP